MKFNVTEVYNIWIYGHDYLLWWSSKGCRYVHPQPVVQIHFFRYRAQVHKYEVGGMLWMYLPLVVYTRWLICSGQRKVSCTWHFSPYLSLLPTSSRAQDIQPKAMNNLFTFQHMSNYMVQLLDYKPTHYCSHPNPKHHCYLHPWVSGSSLKDNTTWTQNHDLPFGLHSDLSLLGSQSLFIPQDPPSQDKSSSAHLSASRHDAHGPYLVKFGRIVVWPSQRCHSSGVLYKACSSPLVFFSFVISRSLPISLVQALGLFRSLKLIFGW